MKYHDRRMGRRALLAATGSWVAWDSSTKLGAAEKPVLADRAPIEDGDSAKFNIDRLRSGLGSDMLGWRAPFERAVLRTVYAKISDDSVSVKDWGAKGDGMADDYQAIVLARTAALATQRALLFPEGEYLHSGTLEFGFSHLRVFFRGQVKLKHIGTGRAISFDAGPTPNLDGKNEIHFGWDCPPTLIGNRSTTDLVYVRGCHRMKFDARLRDSATGMRVEFSVLSHFRINGSANEGPFPDQQPTNWLVVDRRSKPEATTACKFECILEGALGFGLELKCAQHCEFWGTSEGNSGGGVWIGRDSINNNFHNFFCEQNGTFQHWLIDGNNNVLINCTGGAPSNTGLNNNIINGIRNQFISGNFHDVSEVGYYNSWNQVSLTGSYQQNSQSSIREKCHDGAMGEIADAYPRPTVIVPDLAGRWTNAGIAGIRNVGHWKDRYGHVYLIGGVKSGDRASVIFTLPAGSRPGGTVWRKIYDPEADSEVVVAIRANGEVRHISGSNSAIPLDGIDFLAEN